MTTSDYILDLALIGIVFLQIRGRRLSARSLLLPIVIVAIVAKDYLHSIPTAGNDLILIAGCTALGIALGAGAAVWTRLHRGADGTLIAKAGWIAATLWVLGVGCRFAFQEYATHGGGAAIARFSAHHGITTMEAWVTALVLMALGEAVTRTAVLGARAFGPARLRGARVTPAPTRHTAAVRPTPHTAAVRPTMMNAGEQTY